jgi:hypothetical protein
MSKLALPLLITIGVVAFAGPSFADHTNRGDTNQYLASKYHHKHSHHWNHSSKSTPERHGNHWGRHHHHGIHLEGGH